MSYTVNITWSNNAEHIKAPYIAELWQWDRGVVFNIEGIEDVPNYYQPQFSFVKSNGKLSDYAICGATVARTGHVTNPITVSVPNQATDAPGVISFYLAYMESMTSTEIHKTVHVGDILIKKRPRPAGVEPEDGGSGGGSGGGSTGTVGYTTPEAFSGTDTQKVQAALDYANTNGIPVVLPKTYRITSTLQLNDTERVIGGGLTYTGTGFLFTLKNTANLHGVSFENVKLTGNGSNSGIIFSSIGGQITNCTFSNFINGVSLLPQTSDLEGVRIEGSRFINCTTGIRQMSPASASTIISTKGKNNEITGNYFECDTGINASNVYHENINNNVFNLNGTTGTGISITGAYLQISHNDFQTTEAIQIQRSEINEHIQITNNMHLVSADGTFFQIFNEDLTTEISSMLVAHNDAYSGNAGNYRFIFNGNDTQSRYYILYNFTNGTITNASNCHIVNF